MAVFSTDDRKYMEKALELAEKGRGRTRPNPMVGAVIVKNGKIISEGYHRAAGRDHAEIDAIKKSGTDVEGAAIYVTLEPCTVTGRTPPCADKLIEKRFGRVIVGSLDPNPLVMGRGIRKIESAGIDIETGLLEDRVKKQNEVFFKNMQSGMPFVCAKIASSIDGKLAAATSDSRWITGSVSREKVQELRWEYGCVLTGINTVLADDPTLFPKKKLGGTLEENLDSFLEREESSSFTRVILDSRLRIPSVSAIAATSDRIRTIVFAAGNPGKENLSADIDIEFKGSGRWQPAEVMKLLYEKYGIPSVMLEAGPAVLTSFLEDGIIDKFIFFIAPRIIGGREGYSMFVNTAAEKVSGSKKLKFDSSGPSGEDIFITAYPPGKKGL